MADYLLDLASKPLAKNLLKRLKLPIPLPEQLARSEGGWGAKPLNEKLFMVGAAPTVSATSPGGTAPAAGRGAGELPLGTVIEDAGGLLLGPSETAAFAHGLVFDASSIVTSEGLRATYDFLKPRLPALAQNGRVLLLGRDPATLEAPEAAAAQTALIGLAKSLAKELGRKGATCQVLFTAPNANDAAALATPLRYFLSARSAFVSGQALSLTESAFVPEDIDLDHPLNGKVALVTGAARGIGAEIARRLAAEGAKVFVVDRPQEKDALDALASELKGHAVAVDLAQDDAPRILTSAVEAEAGRLDVLVNNAGITRDKTLARMPADWWDDVLSVNLKAAIRLTDAFALGRQDGLGQKELIKLMGPHGRVVMLSSIGGIAGNAGQTNYATAKAGLLGYVRAMAPRLAARGITINALAPGFIETKMTQAMPVATREVARRFNSLSQAGQPGDVADAAVFFASPGAYAVTGETLRVCGQNLIGA